MSMEYLEEKALRLEQQQATCRLIAHLTGTASEAEKAPGRYAYFYPLLEKHPRLFQCLLNNDQKQIGVEWLKVQAQYQTDMRFLHTLTIIYWEVALAKLAQQQVAEREWVIGTGMWIMLLNADVFWSYFSEDRWTDAQGERIALNALQSKELRQNTLNDIITLHSTIAKQQFSAGRYDQTRIHLRCLDICRERSKQFFTLLRQYGIPCITPLNESTLDWTATQAFKSLNAWCAALVEDAEKEANDADAIKRLPAGIRLNYSGGLQVLQHFIALDIPIMRVLCAALKWYNEWGYDVLILKDTGQLQQVTQAAHEVVRQLALLSTKGKGYTQENKLLSEHFLQHGLAHLGSAQAIKHFEESLAWDPTRQTAEELLSQEYFTLYIQPAIECAKNKQFDKAHKLLDEAERKMTDKETAQGARAVIYFRQGQELAQKGKYRQALVCAQKAAQLNTEEPAIQNLLEQMQEAAPEEDNMRAMKTAEKALEDEKYDQAIRGASSIPKTSMLYKRACSVRCAAHVGIGMAALDRKDAEFAVKSFRTALTLDDDDDEETRITIKKFLSLAITVHAVQMVEDAPSYSVQDAARKARTMLNEAITLDPGNDAARRNLKTINDNI